MTIRGLLALAWVGIALLLAACGGGSGRGGTDVVVSGSGPTGTVAGGDAVSFSFTVTNTGGNAASDVQLSSSVTPGTQVTVTSVECTAASGGASCPSAPGVAMSVASLPAGASLQFKVNAQVADNYSGPMSATMAISLADDLNAGNNRFQVDATSYSAHAALVVQGSGPSGTVTAGGSAPFSMSLRNDGPDAASDLSIVNDVGSNLALLGITCSATGGATCPTTLGPSMTLASLPAGGELVFTVNTTVNNNAGDGTVVNRLSVTAAADTDRSDSAFLATATVRTPRSGVSVTTVSVPAAPVPAGGVGVFVMQVANGGPDAATDVRIVDTVSGNLTYRAATCTAGGGATCPTDLSPSMTLSSLPAGGTLNFTVNAAAASDANGAITNTMTVSATNDADRSDNTAIAVGTAFATSVSVATTAPGPMVGGGSAAFTAVVANAGPAGASSVPLSLTLGTGLSQGGTITCTASGGATCPAATGLTMTAPSIPASGSLSFSVPVVAAAGFNGNAAVSLTATAAGDTRTGDNTGSASVAIASADLGASMAVAGSQVAAGNSAVFTATVGNPGPGAASNLTLTQALSGAGASGATATITCSASAGATCPTVGPTMTVPSLAAGRTLSFTITVPLASTARGAVTSTMTVAAAGDPSTANNTASATTTAVDPRNGSYVVYTAAGATASMAVDFDALQYRIDGGTPVAFTGSGNEFVVSGASRLRVSGDLIVGLHDFGGGALPYVAARSFGTTTSAVQGSYNVAVRTGSSTAAASAVISTDGLLFVCQQATGLPVAVTSCPSTSLQVYSLSASGGVFTATPQGAGTGFTFRVALSEGAKFFLAADGSTLRIAPMDPPALPGGSLAGADSRGRWQSVTLSSGSYASTDLDAATDSATLQAVSGFGSSSMRVGNRASDNARIFVMQAGGLAVVIGHPADAAVGQMQLLAR